MASCAAGFILGLFWIHTVGEELPRGAVLSWFRERVLEDLGLEEPPPAVVQGPDVDVARPGSRNLHRRVPRTRRAAWVNHQSGQEQEPCQMILFPSSDSSCPGSDSHFTYHFQSSTKLHDSAVTSGHFWFFAGGGSADSSSAPLFILTSSQQLLEAAEAPSESSSDGWTTYHMDHSVLAFVAEGPFLLRVRCPACRCHAHQPDKTPFLHLQVQPRAPVRSPRSAPLSIPWSPSAVDLLRRPSQDKPVHSDCRRAEIDISFEELGWGNWIVHPKVVTFYYCHGNCSAGDRTTAMLGITQCCAPVPGTMKSLRITTTSDGGYSFKYETLPNIIPEECTCI